MEGKPPKRELPTLSHQSTTADVPAKLQALPPPPSPTPPIGTSTIRRNGARNLSYRPRDVSRDDASGDIDHEQIGDKHGDQPSEGRNGDGIVALGVGVAVAINIIRARATEVVIPPRRLVTGETSNGELVAGTPETASGLEGHDKP